MKLVKLNNNNEINSYYGLRDSMLWMVGNDYISNKYTWFLAINNAEWLGYGGLCKWNNSDSHIYFGPTFVKPEHRNQGLQRELIWFRLTYAIEQGYEYAISCVYRENFISGNNLIRTGFSLMDYDKFKYNPGNREVWFQKKLPC